MQMVLGNPCEKVTRRLNGLPRTGHHPQVTTHYSGLTFPIYLVTHVLSSDCGTKGLKLSPASSSPSAGKPQQWLQGCRCQSQKVVPGGWRCTSLRRGRLLSLPSQCPGHSAQKGPLQGVIGIALYSVSLYTPWHLP